MKTEDYNEKRRTLLKTVYGTLKRDPRALASRKKTKIFRQLRVAREHLKNMIPQYTELPILYGVPHGNKPASNS